MPAAPRRVMSRARACPMPPAAPVITATCPLIVCILTAPPDGASRVLILYVSRPGSSMVLGIVAFINHYYNFPRHSSRPLLLLRNLFLRLQKKLLTEKADRPKIEQFQAATARRSLESNTHGVGAPKRFLDLV